MSKSYDFPRDPRDRRDERFADPSGGNPFADDAPAQPPSDNPYAAPAFDSQAPYHPQGYETFLPHRGGVILTLGLLGLIGSGVAVLFSFCCLPVAVLNLALTMPAWLLGRADLRAIDAGAMDPSGRGPTMAGYVLGIIGSIISLLITLAAAGFIVFAILSNQ